MLIKSCKKLSHIATFLQKSCNIFISCKKTFIFSAKLARYVQDLIQDLANLARKILARLAYFLHDGFYWVIIVSYVNIISRMSKWSEIIVSHSHYCEELYGLHYIVRVAG